MFYIVILKIHTHTADLKPFHHVYVINDKKTFHCTINKISKGLFGTKLYYRINP